MSQIAIFVEGGGSGKALRRDLREAFDGLLRSQREAARRRGIEFQVVPCGPRGDAYNDFLLAVGESPEAINILLVDAEGPVAEGRSGKPVGSWEHLRRQESWARPEGVDDDRCFLMTQCMEAWLVADAAAVQEHYGQCLAVAALPKRKDVEAIPKGDVLGALEKATSKCPDAYRKSHAFKILRRASPEKVRSAAPECERLFAVLAKAIGASE